MKNKKILNTMYGSVVSNNFKDSRITFYGISKTIEVLNNILKKVNLDEIESYKIKDLVDCIIKLDEQLNKYDIKAKCFMEVKENG